MRFSSFFEELAATPSYLVVTFLVLLLAMHAALVWWGRLSDAAWKRVDYIWLSTAALGLVAGASSADRFLSSRYVRTEVLQTEFAYAAVRSYLETGGGPGSALCAPHPRTETSPPDNEEIEKARASLCARFRKWDANLPEKVSAPYPSLKEYSDALAATDHKYVGFYIEDLTQFIRNYEDHSKKANGFASSSKTSFLDDLLVVISPLLLMFALALRFTKVSGELANAKRKAAK